MGGIEHTGMQCPACGVPRLWRMVAACHAYLECPACGWGDRLPLPGLRRERDRPAQSA